MMYKIFSVTPNTSRDELLLFLRVVISAFMLVHGLPKLQMLFAEGPVEFPNVFGMGTSLSLALAVFAEVLCSVLILFGLGTRIAAIPLIITMIVAVFYIHGSDPFSKKEMGLHYLVVYIVLLIAGSGKYSADHRITRALSRQG